MCSKFFTEGRIFAKVFGSDNFKLCAPSIRSKLQRHLLLLHSCFHAVVVVVAFVVVVEIADKEFDAVVITYNFTCTVVVAVAFVDFVVEIAD